MVITIDTENIFDKNPISIPNLNFHKVGTEGNFPNMINGIYRKKPTDDTIFNAEILNVSP